MPRKCNEDIPSKNISLCLTMRHVKHIEISIWYLADTPLSIRSPQTKYT